MHDADEPAGYGPGEEESASCRLLSSHCAAALLPRYATIPNRLTCDGGYR